MLNPPTGLTVSDTEAHLGMPILRVLEQGAAEGTPTSASTAADLRRLEWQLTVRMRFLEARVAELEQQTPTAYWRKFVRWLLWWRR